MTDTVIAIGDVLHLAPEDLLHRYSRDLDTVRIPPAPVPMDQTRCGLDVHTLRAVGGKVLRTGEVRWRVSWTPPNGGPSITRTTEWLEPAGAFPCERCRTAPGAVRLPVAEVLEVPAEEFPGKVRA